MKQRPAVLLWLKQGKYLPPQQRIWMGLPLGQMFYSDTSLLVKQSMIIHNNINRK